MNSKQSLTYLLDVALWPSDIHAAQLSSLSSQVEPSELAKQVTKAFQDAAQAEVQSHIARGEPVVGWIKDDITNAVRADKDKPRVDLLPTLPLEEIAKVLGQGALKYPPNNWREGMTWSRCYASCLRHLFAWWRGENLDQETGLSHLAHAACNILFLLEYELTKKGTDDRYIR